MKELILGGVRSGKSRLAEQRAHASGFPVVFIATAMARGDAELEARIQHHRARRPPTWLTVEEPYSLGGALAAHAAPERCVVLECLTLWLTNLLCSRPECLEAECRSLCTALADARGAVILVANEASLGVVPLGELSRRWLDVSGELHQRLAALCDRVTLTVAGLPWELKSPRS
jgi:adenosylcobinamide kinase/adenosylcobinamide-phosphate guanylyltransferase